MAAKTINLRGIVLTWTILTTTFFWTSTMRILLKPEISSWSIFNLGGKGFLGEFWLPPLIVLYALFMFYLEGRGRMRPLYQVMLVGWHLAIAGILAYGSLLPDGAISFGTWGITVSFAWLVIPQGLFLLLALLLVIRENRKQIPVPVFDWDRLNRRTLLYAALLLPVAILFFWLGTGFNIYVKIAVASTIVQWIFLTEGLGRPYPQPG